MVRGVPTEVVVSNLAEPGTTLREAGAPARSSRPAIEGRKRDIVRLDALDSSLASGS